MWNNLLKIAWLLWWCIPPTTFGHSPHPRTLASFTAHGRVNDWLRVDKSDGDKRTSGKAEWLVLATVNRLYVLDLVNLSMAHEAVTGPVLDSPFCNAELNSCVGARESIVETDNWNKLLLPLNSGSTVGQGNINALLVCGSTRQGECHLRQFPSLAHAQEHHSLLGHWQHVPVVANSPEASSAALLAGDRLFVGASSAHEESPYREGFPAVATRLLSDGLQPVHAGSLDGEAAVHIRAEFRARLRVTYLYAFRDQFFAYWLATQPKSAHSGAPTVTRLIRVCLEDDRYTSYSELELQCRSGEDNSLFGVARAGTLHDQQLWVAFNDGEGRKSAVCAFTLAKLRLTFWYNIDRCRGGTDTIGLPHIGRDAKCTNRSHLPLSEDTCLLGVGGTIEASAPALLILPAGQLISALDVADLDGHLLLAAGTEQGRLLQMEALGEHSTRRLRIYADFRAAPDPIQKVAILKEQQKLLLASDKELLILRLSNCDGTNNFDGTCSECLNAGDPLCAWCLPLGRCTRPTECPSPQALLHRCPMPTGPIRPANLSLSARTAGAGQFLLPMAGLPAEANVQYTCYFGANGLSLPGSTSEARLRPEGIQCALPDNRPQLSSGEDSVRMPILLRAQRTRSDLVQPGMLELTLYSCAVHKLCSSCANSRWPCRWCASQRKCLDIVDFNGQCPRESRQTAMAGCARILPATAGNELMIPADSSNISLELPVENLPSGLPLSCRIGHGQPRTAQALSGGGKVRCSPVPLSFQGPQPMRNLTLELLANGEPVDATTVTVYKCANLASDCSRCVALDPRFACSWCDGSCRHGERCGRNPAGAMAADELCTEPAIHSFSPKSGPLEGGTLVEIQGRDLGSRLQDVQDRVRVAGVPCRVLQYEVSERILCQTGMASAGTTAGPIRITIGRSGRRSVDSPPELGHFTYRSPEPQSVQPGFGPQSGGTRVDIFGQHLDIGRNVTIHLDNLECQLRERQPNQLSCLTAPSPRLYTVTAIRLQFDGAIRLMPTAKFEYRPDPTVREVQPKTAPESGGRNLTVIGTNFDSILTPKLFLLSPPIVPSANEDEWELVSELGICRVLNASRMECQSPRLSLPTALLRQSQLARWTMGFAMDGVKSVRNLGPGMQLTTVPDPQFSPFPGIHQLQPEQPLMLTGQWLSQAASPEEFWVGIGMERCPVFLLEPDRLLCHPPQLQPLPTDDSGVEMADGRPLVVVRIGRTRVEIGPLEYAQNGAMSPVVWTRRMAAGAALALLALAFGMIGLGWLWRRRQGEHERTYRRIQLQMEQMESQVRQECKQAFAELQTDVLAELDGNSTANCPDESLASLGTNGTLNGASSTIPLLDRREFLARLLLRDSADPAVLASFGCGGIYASAQTPMTLAQFDALIWNRPFLYVLVQMAEEDGAVSAAERSTLASLLLVALSRNWAFASDVVLSLLSAHIQRCTLTRQAHLLFRHSDSLVEKLFQHWLAVSLLPWLHCPQQGPARPFYLLYRALKSLTEKGPVDAVTGQARYSLSELSLLREPLDPSTLNLLVVPLDGFDQAPLQVRVLDCDTVGQVKAKLLDTLYRNTPHSQRISTDHFDLEWRCPRRGAVLLLDDDQPHLQKAPRRLNTMAHYGVPDHAMLAMQSRPVAANQQFTFRSGSSDHSTFTLGWQSSANHLLSASSSSSSDTSNVASPGGQQQQNHSEHIYFHLSTPTVSTAKKNGKLEAKRPSAPILPEVLLTRLLMCKGTLQKFVDGFIQSVLFDEGQPVPIVLKYVFDFLDAQAEQNQCIDDDILHAWKSNCWVLRFWQQLLHNPDLLFDVPRQPCLAGSFAVLGQTLVDAFSRSDLALGKESPSSKLLFAREIARYRPSAEELFRRIRAEPQVSTPQFYEYAGSLSKLASDGLSSRAALAELLNWAKANGLRLVQCLDADPEARRLRLGERLRQIVQSSLLETNQPEMPSTATSPLGPLHEEHVYATLR